MSEQQKLRVRIRSLLARTAKNGCTQAEAETAAAMAEKLIRDAGIDIEMLGSETPSRIELVIASRRGPEDRLLGAVAGRAQVLAWTSTRFDGRSVVYFGYDGDLLIAEYLHEIAFRTLATLLKHFRATAAYKRRRTPKTRAAASKAFKEGAIIGLCHALVRTGKPVDQTKMARLEAEQNALELEFRDVKSKASKTDRRFAQEHGQGWAAGQSTAIRDGMVGSAAMPLLGWR